MGVSGENNSDLYLPWDVACTSEGHVYVADCGHYCVKVFTMEGEYMTKIGSEGTGRGQFKHLSSICIDSNDYLYTLDMENACVSVFNPRGDFMMQFGTPGQLQGQFNKPRGITVDSEGRVYVSDGDTPTLVDLVWLLGRVQVFQ
jgi:DNA-binding beta-propeller fold protein YncE